MSCPHCSDGCNGTLDPSLNSLDFDVDYQSSDCKIDDTDTPWWVDIKIDSDRGGKVYLKIELSSLNSNITIDSNNNPKTVRVPKDASGKEENFKISQSTGNNPPNEETIEIDIKWKQKSNENYSLLADLSVDRKLSNNP
jgi:hypothetical protein